MTARDSDNLEVATCQGFGASYERFFSDALSTRVEARFLQPAVFLQPADIDLGTLGIQPIALTARWHLAPHARFSPYAGAGAAYVRFGDLDDQSGDAIAVDIDPEIAFVGEGGVRWRVAERIFIDVGATYMPVDAKTDIHRAPAGFPDRVRIQPLILGSAISWRF